MAVVSGGTADEAVAEECRAVADAMGCYCYRVSDVSVDGLHRILHNLPGCTPTALMSAHPPNAPCNELAQTPQRNGGVGAQCQSAHGVVRFDRGEFAYAVLPGGACCWVRHARSRHCPQQTSCSALLLRDGAFVSTERRHGCVAAESCARIRHSPCYNLSPKLS